MPTNIKKLKPVAVKKSRTLTVWAKDVKILSTGINSMRVQIETVGNEENIQNFIDAFGADAILDYLTANAINSELIK